MKTNYRIFSIFCLLIASLQVMAKPQPSHNALLGKRVLCIDQDAKGYIWVGTKQGLFKYNGSTFLEFSAGTDSVSLNSYFINDIVSDANNMIWMINECGVASWNGSRFRFPKGSTYNPFRQIEVMNDTLLLVNTYSSYRIFDKRNFGTMSENSQSELLFSVMSFCKKNQLIFSLNASKHVITVLDNKLIVKQQIQLPFAASKILVDEQRNSLWIVGPNNLKCLSLDSFVELPVDSKLNDFVKSRDLLHFKKYGSDSFIMGAHGECMYIYDALNSTITPFYSGKQIDKDENDVCFVDKDLNVWLSDANQGVIFYPHYQLAKTITKPLQEIFKRRVTEMNADNQGYIWILNNGTLVSFDSRTGLIKNAYPESTLWFYVDKKGNLILRNNDNSTLTICSVKDGGIVNRHVVHVPFEPATASFTTTGEIWFSDYRQVGYLDIHEKFHRVDFKEGENSRMQILNSGHGDNVFLGVHSKDIFIWNRQKKAFESIPTGVANVDCLYDSGDGKVWIGSFNEGLTCYDLKSGEKKTWNMSNGFPGNHVKTIQMDDNGHIWMSTPESIFRFTPSNGEIVYIQDIEQGISPQYVRSAMDKFGVLYYTNENGLTVVDTHNPILDIVASSDEIPLEIDYIGVNGKDWDLNQVAEKGLRLKYNEDVLSFSFSGIKFEYGSYLKYSYMLEGFDKDWNFSDTGQSIMYSNLPPGSYVFRARVRNKNGQWSASEIAIPIHISPTIWFTWWAKLLYFLLIVSLVGLAIWIYVRQKVNHERLNLVEKEREMAEEHIQFVSNLSHELHTPLTLIQAPLMQLQHSDSLSDASRSLVDLALRSAGKLRYLSDRILETGKKDRTKESELKVSLGKLPAVVHTMVDNFRFITMERNIKLESLVDSQIEYGYFDLDKVEKILSNLMSNAVKYTDQEKGEIQVQVNLRENADKSQQFISISVLDNGKGISPEKQSLLFTRFDRLQAEQDYPTIKGSGIGLNYSQYLAQIHHGSITFMPRPTGGSIFCLEIPYSKNCYTDEEIEDEVINDFTLTPLEFAVQTQTEGENKKGQILIVEDNSDVRIYLQNLFAQEYDVTTAMDGLEAVERLDAGDSPDIILSDIIMPRMNGYELCADVRKRLEMNLVPFILLTAQNSTESHLQGLACEADAYVPKPFNPFVLQKQVESLLKKRQRIQQRLSMLTSNTLKKMNVAPDARPEKADAYGEKIELNEYDRKFLEKVYACMDEHLKDSSYSSALLAQDVYMSLSSFSNRLKQLLGTTPHNFINNYKMNRALELLRQGMPISEVCYEIGASAVSNFSRTFKQKFGVTPGQYQQIKDDFGD